MSVKIISYDMNLYVYVAGTNNDIPVCLGINGMNAGLSTHGNADVSTNVCLSSLHQLLLEMIIHM